MGRRRQQHQLAVFVRRQALEQTEPLLAPALRPNAGMGFVDDDHAGADARELVAAAIGLDVVEADHCERVGFEQADARGQFAFQARGRGSRDRCRVDVELGPQFLVDPLLHQMRRAKDSEPGNLAPIDQLSKDEARLDGLAYADVVGDQQPNDRQPQGHHQGHELIGAGFETETGGRSERTGATSH